MSTFACPSPAQTAQTPLTPLEQLMRAKAVSYGATFAPRCVADLHVGAFFDGTNNNRKRDQLDVQDPDARSHSNVVVLFDTYATKRAKHFRIYVPGVGTPFPEIGEMGESSDGKALARGGEARIHWGMIQLLNSIHQGALGAALVNDERAKTIIRSALGGHHMLDIGLGNPNRRLVFRGLITELASAIRGAKPSLQTLHLSVFGFSRGAAEARTFCYWLNDLWETVVENGGSQYDCIPRLRMQFVGLFDTVASVGLANSAPVSNDGGFMGWADGTLELPARIERCVHYAAMHEIRKSFPLSTARKSACAVTEVMYPGAHSDVGGGYAPGYQGKGNTRADLLSQVPLLHMYREARNAGVPLADLTELVTMGRQQTGRELELSSALVQRFDAYLNVGPKAGDIKTVQREHMRWYWRWRLAVGDKVEQLHSVQAASAQDKEDLLASEQDFRRDIGVAIKDREAIAYRKQHPIATNAKDSMANTYRLQSPIAATVTSAMRDAMAARNGSAADVPVLSEAESIVLAEKAAKSAVPSLVAEFFDQHVHDSHASFYLAGPATALDRKQLIDSVLEKQKRGEALNGYERRVAALQLTRPGQLPTITDADTSDLLARESVTARTTVKIMTATRRESEGHVRDRVIFDRS